MKNALLILGALLGGFVLYKLLGKSGGSASGGGQPSISSPNTAARFENVTTSPASGNRIVQARTDNTAQIIGAVPGLLNSLVGVGTNVAKLFNTNTVTPALNSSPAANFNLIESGGGFQFSQGTTPAVDYTVPSWNEPSFDWSSSTQTLWS